MGVRPDEMAGYMADTIKQLKDALEKEKLARKKEGERYLACSERLKEIVDGQLHVDGKGDEWVRRSEAERVLREKDEEILHLIQTAGEIGGGYEAKLEQAEAEKYLPCHICGAEPFTKHKSICSARGWREARVVVGQLERMLADTRDEKDFAERFIRISGDEYKRLYEVLKAEHEEGLV